jgi:hypothetical protein
VRWMGKRGRDRDGGEEEAPLATVAEGEEGCEGRGDVVRRGEGDWRWGRGRRRGRK